MTDGIIQEVFKFYYAYKDSLAHKDCKECQYAIEEVLPRLIEKIKQELDNYKCYLGCTNEEHLLRKKDVLKSLLGDNQE